MNRTKYVQADLDLNMSDRHWVTICAAPCKKMCLWAYADSEGSDESVHPRRLSDAFTVH